jgi:putative FmdB family regulatory protein
MPTYQYRRPDGSTFEVFQKITDASLATDPETGVPVERVISGGAGLQFKGTGFYLTDYARAGSGSKGGGDSDTGSASSSASSDAKSGAAADAKSAKTESSPASKTPSTKD